MSTFKKNLLSVYGVNLINGLCGIAFIPLALRYLGSEGYGLFSIFIILTSYVYLAELGITRYFTRILAQDRDILKQKKQIQLAVSIYFRIGVILILITPIFIYVVPKYVFPVQGSETILIIIIVFAIIEFLLSIPSTLIMIYNIGNEKFINVSKFNLISGITRHFLLITTVLLFHSLIVVMSVVLLRRCIDVFYALKTLDKLPKGSWKPNYNKGEFKRIVSQSIFLSMSQLAQITVLALGTYLVNKHFSIKEVGNYKAAFDLTTKIWFISNGLGLVVFPKFSSILTSNSQKINLVNKMKVYNQVSWFLYNFIFIIALFCLPLLKEVLLIEEINLFALLLLGVCLNAHTNLSYEYLQAEGKFKIVTIINFLVLIIMVLVFYGLLNNFELISIGLAWLVSQFIYSFVLDIIVFKDNISCKKLSIQMVINFSVLIISVFSYFALI
jgi:O-antigen/teichoic acid export membrane protein